MMRRVIISGTAAMLPFALASVANPQDGPGDGEIPEGPTRYHVEVIVFVNDDIDPTEELFHYRSHMREVAPIFPPETPVKVETPVVVWSIPENEADGDSVLDESSTRRPPPGTIGIGDSAFGLPEARPDNRPRIVLEGLPGPEPVVEGFRGLAPALENEPANEPASEFAVLPVDQLPVLPVDQLPLLQEDEAAGRYLDELEIEVAYRPAPGLPGRTFRYRLLRRDELQLTDAYARLDRLDAYTPLLHSGWVQEGLGEEEAIPFDLAYLGVVNPTGTIQLHVIRFLHVTLDLDYRLAPRQSPAAQSEALALAPGQPAPEIAQPVFGALGPYPRAELEDVELAPHYFIGERRRTRSGELSYFDHPAFGVLVLVTPAPEAPEESDEDTENSRPAA